MSRRVVAVVASLFVSGLVGGLTGIAWAVCVDTPITITFDAGSGTPHCYTESGMTICASQGYPPGAPDDSLTLGDNDGDTSPDLMNHEIPSDVLVYTFSMGGAPFALTSFDFVNDTVNGRGTFTPTKPGSNSCCADFDQYDSGVVTPPEPDEWSGITSFTWAAYSYDPGEKAVMDNLSIVAQCCGNGVVDAGEQCDDGNTLGIDDDGNCCSATCQFEAAGEYCTADENFCTADLCDGAGTCSHPDLPNCDLTRPCGPTRPPGNVAFEHPKKTSTFKSELVQAYIVCGDVGGNSPNGTTEGGVPSCSNETPNEEAGSPTNGWQWDESKGKGYVQSKATCKGADDASVKLKISGVVDGNGAPANSQGTLAVSVSMTLDDPSNGNMTAITVSGEVPLTLLDGNGGLTTTLGVILTESGFTEIPNGTSIEFLQIEVRDPNGNTFARPGLFLP